MKIWKFQSHAADAVIQKHLFEEKSNHLSITSFIRGNRSAQDEYSAFKLIIPVSPIKRYIIRRSQESRVEQVPEVTISQRSASVLASSDITPCIMFKISPFSYPELYLNVCQQLIS